MLVDANILLYSVDTSSPFHRRADAWLVDALNGDRRVGIPWSSLWAFVRIATNPRAARHPLTPAEAWEHVEGWLDAPATWTPEPGRGHRAILGELVVRYDLRGALVADAALAALCIEHGLTMVSADSDFARFTDVPWINPVA
jgi:toxin-antitoxin system PIN domain toxin